MKFYVDNLHFDNRVNSDSGLYFTDMQGHSNRIVFVPPTFPKKVVKILIRLVLSGMDCFRPYAEKLISEKVDAINL